MPDETRVILRGLEGNDTARLFDSQISLLPYAGLIEYAWFVLWWVTLAYVAINHILVPLLLSRRPAAH